LGFNNDQVALWQIFSHVIKLVTTVNLGNSRTSQKTLFNFHESVVASLKPVLDSGVRSIIIAAPSKTSYASELIDHMQKHHAYLMHPSKTEKITFKILESSCIQPHDAAQLVKNTRFQKLIRETTAEEADSVIVELEKHLHASGNSSMVHYSLEEIENQVYKQGRDNNLETGYLLLTDKYLTHSKNKGRINRLMQIAKNRKVKTKVVDSENPAGRRIDQLGGIVFFDRRTS
jgi:stalled ribosome rescue protein Dom34